MTGTDTHGGHPVRRRPTDDDLVLEVNAAGGIPLGLAGYLLRAIGAAYPNTSVKTGPNHGAVLQLLIPRDDLYQPTDVTDDVLDVLADLGGEKDIAELTAFTSGWRDGALGLRPPEWLSVLLQAAAGQMVDAMPPTAENYVAIEINRPDGDDFVWIVSRPGRPSPHDLRRQAEAERDRYRSALQAIGEAQHGGHKSAMADFEALAFQAREALRAGDGPPDEEG